MDIRYFLKSKNKMHSVLPVIDGSFVPDRPGQTFVDPLVLLGHKEQIFAQRCTKKVIGHHVLLIIRTLARQAQTHCHLPSVDV